MSSSQSSLAEVRASEVIASPCIGVCTLGPGDICIGCLRTTDEIGNWSNFSVQERSQLMADLPKRMEVLFAR